MSQSANPQLPLHFAFFSMPFLMGLISHFMVPPGDDGVAVALPDGSSALHVAALGLAAALMVGSVAVGISPSRRYRGRSGASRCFPCHGSFASAWRNPLRCSALR
jgi:hypothetical protein